MNEQGHATDVAKAVGIAALSALFTALITWGVEEVKKRVSPPPAAKRPR